MHSSVMHTACSSSHPGGSPPGTPIFCGGLLVWWSSGVVVFCYGLLANPINPYQKAAFNRRPPNHNRRPQQKAITEGHTPLGPATPRTRYPPRADPLGADPLGPVTPLGADPQGGEPPAARHAGIPPAMHVGIAPPVDRQTPVKT